MQKRLNDKEKIELVEKYETGQFTCRDLSKQYGITSQAISGLLTRRKVRVNNNQSQLQKKYSQDENYFNKIIGYVTKNYQVYYMQMDIITKIEIRLF